MCRGAGYRNAQRSELLAEHFKKATDIGRKSALLSQPAKKFGLATGRWRIESIRHSSTDISQIVMTVMTNLIVVHQLSDAKSLGFRFPAIHLIPPLDWLWLRNQPQSALALWFKEWVNRNGAVSRRPPSWRWRASCWWRCGNM